MKRLKGSLFIILLTWQKISSELTYYTVSTLFLNRPKCSVNNTALTVSHPWSSLGKNTCLGCCFNWPPVIMFTGLLLQKLRERGREGGRAGGQGGRYNRNLGSASECTKVASILRVLGGILRALHTWWASLHARWAPCGR